MKNWHGLKRQRKLHGMMKQMMPPSPPYQDGSPARNQKPAGTSRIFSIAILAMGCIHVFLRENQILISMDNLLCLSCRNSRQKRILSELYSCSSCTRSVNACIQETVPSANPATLMKP